VSRRLPADDHCAAADGSRPVCLKTARCSKTPQTAAKTPPDVADPRKNFKGIRHNDSEMH